MSKWTDIRDSITSVLKVDDVTEEVKEKSLPGHPGRDPAANRDGSR